MSAFTVDITRHLEESLKFIKLGPNADDVLQVDDKKNTVIRIQSILNADSSADAMDKALELALGKDGLKKINSLNLSMEAYQSVFIGVMAAINCKTFEEMEKTFRDTQK